MPTKQPTGTEPHIWPQRDRTIPTANKTRARAMRVEPTQAERKLWWHLRHRLPIPGSHFRRQVHLGRYIVDFACHQLRLVLEIDGGQHAERTAQDEQRSHFLESEGYRVLRFRNIDVLNNIEGVLEVIHNEIGALSESGPTPTPTPPHKGEGK
jgi:very-short-patch-repair endonuclease